MPSLSDDGFDGNRPMTVFLKLACIHSGIMCVPYSAADVRRFVTVQDDDLEVNEDTDDPLAELLVESLTGK